MSDHLPPLTALRAFDAAARHMSFARAAEELNVTPAALSFQIKSLEEHLGQPLFRRLNRAVELTEAGRALAPGASDGFQILSSAWRAARRLQDQRTLTVTAGPALTAKWMAPRLYDFAQAHPEIELRFSASLRIMDFDRDEIDVAIRFGYGPDPDLYALPLAEEWVTPVMIPDLAARYPTPESLTKAPLIFDESISFLDPPCDWPAWFRAVGIDFTPDHGAAVFTGRSRGRRGAGRSRRGLGPPGAGDQGLARGSPGRSLQSGTQHEGAFPVSLPEGRGDTPADRGLSGLDVGGDRENGQYFGQNDHHPGRRGGREMTRIKATGIGFIAVLLWSLLAVLTVGFCTDTTTTVEHDLLCHRRRTWPDLDCCSR